MDFKKLNEQLEKFVMNEHALKSKSGKQIPFKDFNSVEQLAKEYFDLIQKLHIYELKGTVRRQSNDLFVNTYYNPFTQKEETQSFSLIMGSKDTGMLHIYLRHYKPNLYKAIGKVEQALKKSKPLIEEQDNIIQTDRLIYFYEGYAYIIGIPDKLKSNYEDQLYYLHNIYPWTQSQYSKLKSKQESLLTRYKMNIL